MIDKLTPEETSMVLESLKFTKLKFEDYDKYPSYKYKQRRIKEVSDLILKIQELSKN